VSAEPEVDNTQLVKNQNNRVSLIELGPAKTANVNGSTADGTKNGESQKKAR